MASKSRSSGLVKKVQDIAVQDAKEAENLVLEAAKSQAWLYPFKGIYFFLRYPELSRPLRMKLVPIITTAISVTASMFTFTYLPQVAILTFVDGPLAIFSTIFLVLSESSTITNLLSRGWFLENAIVDTFDGTLIIQRQGDLVSKGRVMKSGSSASDAIDRLGKLIKKPFGFSLRDSIRHGIILLLNAFPVIGPVLYILTQSYDSGPRAHSRYFQLKGMNRKQKDEWKKSRVAEYMSFNIPAMLLELIPIVGIFFAFTNTVGAALWAADIEKGKSNSTTPNKSNRIEEVHASQTTGVTHDDDPPAYPDKE